MNGRLALIALFAVCLSNVSAANWKDCENLSDRQKALESCSKIIRKGEMQGSTRLASAHTYRGLIYLDLDKHKRALADFKAAWRLNPGSAMACSLRGAVHYKAKEYSQAITLFSECINLFPKLGMAFAARGRAKLAQGQDVQGIADLSRAIGLIKDQYARLDALLDRGKALEAFGAYERAVSDYTDIIREMPNLSLGYVPRGRTYQKLGKRELAIADYRKALQLEPTNKEAKENLARLQSSQ